MTRIPRLEHATEYLDRPVHETRELEESLDDVAAVNRWLGGRRALLRAIARFVPQTVGGETDARPWSLLDAGTGSADLPRAIIKWARRRGIRTRIVACDLHPQVLGIARRRSADFPEIEFARADVRSLPFRDRAFDIAILSLTLHHLDGADLETALRQLHRVARHAVIVGELERSWPAYLGARLLAATLWRANPLTRHDGPVSVLRAFTPTELHTLAGQAGLPSPRVTRHPLFRLILTAKVTHG